MRRGIVHQNRGGLVEHSGQVLREGKQFFKGKRRAAFFLSNLIAHLPFIGDFVS